MPADPALPANVPTSVPTPTPRRPLWRRVLGLPATRLGWWSLGLALALGVFFFGLFAAARAFGQHGGETFFSNPWLASTALTAGVSGVAAGVAAGLAILFRGERSLLVFVTLLLGLLVLVFWLGEISDHG